MNTTETALQAIAALQALPNWAEIAAIYGGVAEHLADLADDLSRQSWEELAS